ncbi:hypothetical protein JCM14076_26050 [Methylosoma difficile]
MTEDNATNNRYKTTTITLRHQSDKSQCFLYVRLNYIQPKWMLHIKNLFLFVMQTQVLSYLKDFLNWLNS